LTFHEDSCLAAPHLGDGRCSGFRRIDNPESVEGDAVLFGSALDLGTLAADERRDPVAVCGQAYGKSSKK
jgi:hypothetical protein